MTTTGIGKSLPIVMSGSSPVFRNRTDPLYNPIDVRNQATRTVRLIITDLNGNPLPGGTTIRATGTGFTLGQPANYTVACSAASWPGAEINGVNVFTWTVTGDQTAGGGLLSIEVQTPRGLRTVEPFTVLD